jgi:hypothetical protein
MKKTGKILSGIFSNKQSNRKRATITQVHTGNQCCGSVTFWCGFGSGLGTCYFRHWPSRRQQKTNLLKKFFCLLICEGTLHNFSKIKSQKEVTKQ